MKRPRRAKAKKKASDPAYRPSNSDNSDSGSGYDSDPSASSIRRQNPVRGATTTNDGLRINYAGTPKTSDPPVQGRKRSASVTSTTSKRRKIALDRQESKTEIPISSIRREEKQPSDEGKPEPEGGKTTWFFSRMLQGMKNFWTKTDNATTTTSNNNDKKSGASDSNKETVAYNSNDTNAPSAESSKKGRVYYYNEAWHIPADELEVLETISSGTFGDVARARWRGSEVAVKTLRTPSPHVGEKVLNLFLKEVSILSKLRHPAIVHFMGACITPKLCIVMEYLTKGSLYNMLHVQKEIIPYNQIILMAREIAEGLNYLHLSSPKIIHRDVKSSNILVTSTKSIKIADFGISKETTAGSDSTMTGFMGTSSYMSPEMIRGTKYTEKVDVYSFGILLWEMYTHKVPFRSMHALQIAHKVLQGERPQIPDKCPNALQVLLRACWHEQPSERPSFKDIVFALGKL